MFRGKSVTVRFVETLEYSRLFHVSAGVNQSTLGSGAVSFSVPIFDPHKMIVVGRAPSTAHVDDVSAIALSYKSQLHLLTYTVRVRLVTMQQFLERDFQASETDVANMYTVNNAS